MRIAVTSSHRTGKSSLVDELAARLPDHESFAEPYELLVEEGYEPSDPPSLEDFEAQLERSLEMLSEGGDRAIFERCPLDFLAYVSVHHDGDAFDFEAWLPRIEHALSTLDVVVFVPVEPDDRIVLSAAELDDDSRAAVDDALRGVLDDFSARARFEVLEVGGSIEARANTVLEWLRPSG